MVPVRLAKLVACVVGVLSVGVWAGGFDHAIETASARVVRLYGVKAGLSAGYGSGVLISDDGLVVTVSSLLLDAEHLRVVTSDGMTYGAEVIGADHELQLALLRLKSLPQYDRRGNLVTGSPVSSGRFPYFEPGDSRSLIPGDWVIAAGNPFKVAVGAEPISVTVGVYSTRTNLDAKRKTRNFPYRGEVLVIDAITSNPGAPGGALVNLQGEWVGMVGRLVKSNLTHTNSNYAIPVEIVMGFAESVLNPASVTAAEEKPEAYHGIKLFELGYKKKLVYVERVKRGSPARVAGVKKDDLIVSVGGRSVSDIGTFKEIIGSKSPGDRVGIVVIRDDKIESLTVVLEEKQ